MAHAARNVWAKHGLSFAPATDDDCGNVGEDGGCTIKQDAFALALAETGNQSAAYRIAYSVSENTALHTVYNAASRVANLPHVRKRTDEYRQKFALEATFNVQQVFQWRLDIATADPTEVTYVAARSCRYCHGADHKYQWTDEDEYLAAMAKALDEDKPAPSDQGGYGFSRALEPASDCPKCLGDGVPEVVINDLRKLTGKAKKLIAGIDYKNGIPIVKFHDQAKAWDDVMRMLGVHREILIATPKKDAAVAQLPENATDQDALRHYLSVIN